MWIFNPKMSENIEQCKDESWGSVEGKNNDPNEKDYDGLTRMDVDGIIETSYDEVATSFDDMKVKEPLIRGKTSQKIESK